MAAKKLTLSEGAKVVSALGTVYRLLRPSTTPNSWIAKVLRKGPSGCYGPGSVLNLARKDIVCVI